MANGFINIHNAGMEFIAILLNPCFQPAHLFFHIGIHGSRTGRDRFIDLSNIISQSLIDGFHLVIDVFLKRFDLVGHFAANFTCAICGILLCLLHIALHFLPAFRLFNCLREVRVILTDIITRRALHPPGPRAGVAQAVDQTRPIPKRSRNL